MTTTRMRAIVSLATMSVTLVLGGCASSRAAADGPAPMQSRPFAIHFTNDGRDYVHVYLVDDQREWLLGRVEPGAIAAFRIPASVSPSSRFVRLAVLAGEHVTLRAASNALATITILQPASAIVSQQWKFADGQLTSVRLGDPLAHVRRP